MPNQNRKKIQKYFNALGFEPSEKIQGSMKDFCEELADDVRRRAPKDTGELEESVEIQTPGRFNRFKEAKNKYWAVVVNSDHAAAQEYGTHEMPAHPFFRPAIAQAKGWISVYVQDAMGQAIRKIKGL